MKLKFYAIALFGLLPFCVVAQNVGVGTNTPASPLSVKGGLGVGSGTYSESTAAPTNGAIIEGNVGIGLTNPSQKLEVVGAIKTSNADGVKFYLTALNAGSNISHTSGWSIDYNAGPGNSATTGQHRFFTTDGGVYSEKMRIAGNGFVGIGTNGPASRLHVLGDGDGVRFQSTDVESDIRFINSSGYNWEVGTNNSGNGTGSNQFYFYNGAYHMTIQNGTGNVGIGLTNPGAKLDVNGLVDARNGLRTERRYNYFVVQRNANGAGYEYNLGNWDFCGLAGNQVAIGDDTFDGGSDNRRFVYECTLEFNDVWALPGWTGYLTGGDYGYTSRPNWRLYSYSWAQFDQHMVQHCNAVCVNFDY